MTKKLKAISIIGLAVLLTCAIFLSSALYSKPKTVDATVLSTTKNVEVNTQKAVSSKFLNGKTGYEFTSSKNGEKISLKEGVAGTFSIVFTPYSDTTGEVEFTKFTFTLTGTSSRVAINLDFVPSDGGILMNVGLSNSLGRGVTVNMDGSFCNISDKSVRFSFDPDAMVVKNAEGTVVADFKSKDFLYTYHIPEALASFETYSVDMTFGGIKEGETAKVVIFDVCGQRLNGDMLVNTSAPVIYSLPKLVGGVVGVNYTISKDVKTFDVIDGFENEFNGQIKVYDQTNGLVPLTDSSFVPTTAGVYIVEYTPIDAQGLKGQSKSVRFTVYEEQPAVKFVYSHPVSDMEIGVGTKLTFPKIIATSELTDDQLTVFASVVLGDNDKLSNVDCVNGFSYEFLTVGDYTVKFSVKLAARCSTRYSILRARR